MEKVFILLLITVLMASISSCEKEEITGTRIKVLVVKGKYDTETVSSVSVKLFLTVDDARYRKNSIDSKNTNGSGEVVFGDVQSSKKYWVRVVEEDNYSNWDDVTTIENEEASVTIYFDK